MKAVHINVAALCIGSMAYGVAVLNRGPAWLIMFDTLVLIGNLLLYVYNTEVRRDA